MKPKAVGRKELLSNQRKAREKHGRFAENIAAIWLKCCGYRIVKRNVKMRSGEIDIIATRKNVIAFVEVKARPNLDAGLRAVPDKSWRRISRSAEIWMSHQSEFASFDWRYDLIVVCPWKFPKQMKDFWRP